MLLDVFQSLFKIKQLFKNITQRSALKLDLMSDREGDNMGRYLKEWTPWALWNFIPEQLQNPEKTVKYLEKVCCHSVNSREAQITTACWGLAHIYQALFNIIWYPGSKEISGSDDSAIGPAVALDSMTGPMVTLTPETGTTVQPDYKSVPVYVTPIFKTKRW